ncbi:MAG: bifunctional folylpolyglutamate synthase/dihydrofolate synthase [Epsilonproteobacteria bacterium]|nr:bifunctional folylpolyglutamate synthase/dihydrofolate synthase [Campylobacterota bacterium]
MLEDFLNQKPLYYKEIDYTRMPRAYASIKEKLKIPKIIQMIGTNAKGTTGRFLAQALRLSGVTVGHYTSPHIMCLNERIWIDGKDIEDAVLEAKHERLQEILPQEFIASLSYFEYTTLLAMLAFEACEYVVLEAGLGGEYDATVVFENILTVVTPIDMDHEAFLGDSIEAIATTKLNAIKKEAIIAKQKHESVYGIAKEIVQRKEAVLHSVDDILNQEEQHYIKKVACQIPQYLRDNLLTSMAAAKLLGFMCDPKGCIEARLFGRMSKVADNVIVDVGHNALAAHSISKALSPKKYVVVYNSYKDKDYASILKILQPIIKELQIIEVDDPRIAEQNEIERVAESLLLSYRKFDKIAPNEEYLVFGSFSVVATFLKGFNG